MALTLKNSEEGLSIVSHNIEFLGCKTSRLETALELAPEFVEAVRLSGATYLSEKFEQFEPAGVTGVVIVAESHFSIHTWPEHGIAAIDALTCSTSVDIEKFISRLSAFCKPQEVKHCPVKRILI